MSGLGSLARGIAGGLQTGANLRGQRDARQAEQQAAQAERRRSLIEATEGQFKKTIDLAQIVWKSYDNDHEKKLLAMKEGDEPPVFDVDKASQSVDQVLAPMAELIIASSQPGKDEAGNPVPPVLDPNRAQLMLQELRTRRMGIMQSLTTAENRKLSFIEKRSEARAKAEGERIGGLKLNTEAAKQQADIDLATRQWGANSPQVAAIREVMETENQAPDFTTESGIRKEWTKISNNFRVARDGFNSIAAVADNPSAMGDVALIFNYMKVLDPQSTVRESEVEAVQRAAGLTDRVAAMAQRWLDGKGLTDDMRDELVQAAFDNMRGKFIGYRDLEQQFQGIASGANVTPDRMGQVILDFAGDVREKLSEDPKELTITNVVKMMGNKFTEDQIRDTMDTGMTLREIVKDARERGWIIGDG